MLLRFLRWLNAYLLLMVQVSLTCAKNHVVYIRCYLLCKRSVASHAKLQVGTIVTHHIHLCSSKLVTVLLVNPSLNGLYNLGVIETVDMVEPSQVATIAAEESLIQLSLEGHPEIIGLRVERETWVLDSGCWVLAFCWDEINIKPA